MIKHIHWMRGFAIIIIVISHCIGFIGPEGSLLHNVFRTILVDGTVFFMFISGYLFEYLSGRFTFKGFLEKKFKNVLVPYLIVASFGVSILFYFNKIPSTIGQTSFDNYVEFLFFTYFTGVGHLSDAHWFIPMIMIFFVISPILVYLNGKKYFYYSLPFFLLVSILTFRSYSSIDTILNFINYFGIFQLGMFFSKYRIEVDSFLAKNIYAVIIFTAIFTGIDLVFHSVKTFEEILENKEFYINTLQIQKIFFSVMVYALFLKASRKISEIKFLDFFAAYSFGLFFIHMYLIFAVQYFFNYLNIDLEPGLLLFFIVSSIVLSLSVCIIYLVKLVFKEKSRYIIGA